jgi:hypothetical protein
MQSTSTTQAASPRQPTSPTQTTTSIDTQRNNQAEESNQPEENKQPEESSQPEDSSRVERGNQRSAYVLMYRKHSGPPPSISEGKPAKLFATQEEARLAIDGKRNNVLKTHGIGSVIDVEHRYRLKYTDPKTAIEKWWWIEQVQWGPTFSDMGGVREPQDETEEWSDWEGKDD